MAKFSPVFIHTYKPGEFALQIRSALRDWMSFNIYWNKRRDKWVATAFDDRVKDPEEGFLGESEFDSIGKAVDWCVGYRPE